MLRRIMEGLLRSKAKVYPDHVHMTKDGILYTSPDELLRSESVRSQIRKMDSLQLKKASEIRNNRDVD